jgi:voltage-gated sodium channel
VIVRKSEEAYKQVQQESAVPLTQRDILDEIKEIRRILEDLEKRISEYKRDRNANSIDT